MWSSHFSQMRLLALAVLIALSCVNASHAQRSDESAQGTSRNEPAQPAPRAAKEKTRDGTSNPAQAGRAAPRKRSSFIPSEKVSADSAVAFPVDI